MQFVSTFGFVLVGIVASFSRNLQLKTDLRGKAFALISGVLLGLGGIALYSAYRTGENASVITATTSLYPVVTVFLAVSFLREKLNKLQIVGLCFAVAAIILFAA
jgi:transporter family protein